MWLARSNVFLFHPFTVAAFTDFGSLYYQEEYICSSVNLSNLKITLTHAQFSQDAYLG